MSDWLFLCGILSGITTWLFGFGGGFVTVPLLYLLATSGWGAQSAVGQQAMQIAVATSALVMLCSALLATWRHARTGILRWRRLWAILTGIAVGGTAGAMLALQVNGEWIRWLFVIYLLATIIDCYLRAGFMTPPSSRVVPTAPHELTVGGVIGLIASFLGVGGSVMTVPLMRRRGVLMSEAAAMANLLTLPLAATATLTWLVAAAQLVAGSWLGLKIASRWLARLPDRWHVRIYPLLLIAVLLVMSVWG